MLPVALDLSQLPILLIGEGEACARRRHKLEEAGANRLTVTGALNEYDLEAAQIVMVAGLPLEESKRIAKLARERKILVNVEDVNELCDFYFMAQITHGDLHIAVSTNGASPTLAKRVRDRIAALFGPEWARYTQEIAMFRDGLRAQGKTMSEVAEASERLIAEKGWLS